MNVKSVGVTILVFVLMLSGAAVFGQQNAKAGKLKGDFAGFDPGDRSLILSTKDGFVSLSLDMSAEIERDGAPARVEDLRIGELLEIRYDRERMAAMTIRAASAIVKGFITSLQIGGDFVEQYLVAITPSASKPILLAMSPAITIKRDGIVVKPSALRIGDSASAVYDPVTLVATSLEAASAPPEPPAVKGVIVSVQPFPEPGPGPRPGQQSILLQSDARLLKFLVNPKTKISIDGKKGTIFDLRAGHFAVVHFDPVKKVALSIEAFNI